MKKLQRLLIWIAVLGSNTAMIGANPSNTRIINNPIINNSIENQKDSIVCHISGEVVDRPDSKYAILLEAGKDVRTSPYITIPIVDGNFSYTLKDDMPRVYNLTFDDEYSKGAWRTRNFFTGNGSVDFLCGDSDMDVIESFKSDLQDNVLYLKIENTLDNVYANKIAAINDKLSPMFDDNSAYSLEVQTLLNKMKSSESDEEKASLIDLFFQYKKGPKEKMYSKDYLDLNKETQEMFLSRDSLKRSMISDTPTLVGLNYIKTAILYNNEEYEDIPGYIELFDSLYKDNMKDHPYTKDIAEMIEAREVKVGNKYPDYKVTREDGSTEQISSLINGNVSVIDLWASWCGPCRRHSMELIPIYEKYKDKGFKVVAIAREKGDCNAMNEAMKKDGYPWESFVDLNDQDKVWRINRASNSGGKIILVDADGVIVGTDMPIQEIKDFLEKTYGE